MHVRSIGIIGYGDFGRFIAQLSKKHFPNVPVRIHSSRREPDGIEFFSLEDTCQADLVFPCVPIAAFEETIERIAPLLGTSSILCDIATVKVHTGEVLRNLGVPRFITTHPMFGPYSYEKQGDSVKGLRIAVCDSSLSPEDTANIVAFLRKQEFTVLEMSAESHDRLVAETLFLTHLIGQTVKKGDFKRSEIDTVSFGFLMDAVESVAHDEQLFRDVYTYNPYCTEVIKRFTDAEREVINSL